MWQHAFGVYVWRSVWRCKLDLYLHTERHTYTPNACCHTAIMDILYFSNFKLRDFNEETTSSLRMI